MWTAASVSDLQTMPVSAFAPYVLVSNDMNERALARGFYFLFHPAPCSRGCRRQLTGSDDNIRAEQLQQHQHPSKSYYRIRRLGARGTMPPPPTNIRVCNAPPRYIAAFDEIPPQTVYSAAVHVTDRRLL